MLYGRMMVCVLLLAFGGGAAALGWLELQAWIALVGVPQVAVSHAMEVAGGIAFGVMGLLVLVAAAKSFCLWIRPRHVFSITKNAFVARVYRWNEMAPEMVAACLGILPCIVLFLLTWIILGRSLDCGEDRRLMPTLAVHVTAVASVVVTIVVYVLTSGYWYARLRVLRPGCKVEYQKRCWPFSPVVSSMGTVRRVVAATRDELQGNLFAADPECDAWLVLETSAGVVPLRPLASSGELALFQDVARYWNDMLVPKE